MMDPVTFENFLLDLGGDVADILRVDCIRLVLESVQNEEDPAIKKLGDVLAVAEPGFIESYLTPRTGHTCSPSHLAASSAGHRCGVWSID